MAKIKTYTRGSNVKVHHAKSKKKTISLGDCIFILIAIVAAIALALSYVSAFINPAVFPYLTFFGLYYIPIVLVNTAIFLVALCRLNRALFISLVAMIPSLFIVEIFFKSSNEAKDFGVEPVKLLTYNVGRFISNDKNSYNLSEICRFAEEQNPDIVCFQEYGIQDTTLIANYMREHKHSYHHFFRGNGYSGNFTFSKYPIVDAGKMTFSESRNLIIWTDIDIHGTVVRVYNCHLESQGISFTSLIKKLGKKGYFTNEMITVHEKFLKATIRRSEQVNLLLENANNCELPTIICGDFNDTPLSYTYYKLCQNRKDAFVEGGKGFSATYSFMWPLLRIDYILHSMSISADDYRIFKVPYSDHYPVSTLLYLNSPEQ